MKLNFSSLISLPFVKSSQTVSRNQPNQLSDQNTSPPNSKRTPLINKKLISDNVRRGGAGLPPDSIFVSVNRHDINKRKRLIGSSLEKLPSPTKLKKRKVPKSSLVQYGLFRQPILKKNKKYENDILNHVDMVKRKRSSILKSTDSHSCAGPQEVPISPATSYLGMDMINNPSTSYYDDEATPTGKDSSVKFNTLNNLPGPTHHGINVYGINHTGIEATERDTSSTSQQSSDSYDHFTISSADSDFSSAHHSPPPIISHLSPSPSQEEEYVIPVITGRHSYSPYPIQEPFNPQTLGIKMLFPREE